MLHFLCSDSSLLMVCLGLCIKYPARVRKTYFGLKYLFWLQLSLLKLIWGLLKNIQQFHAVLNWGHWLAIFLAKLLHHPLHLSRWKSGHRHAIGTWNVNIARRPSHAQIQTYRQRAENVNWQHFIQTVLVSQWRRDRPEHGATEHLVFSAALHSCHILSSVLIIRGAGRGEEFELGWKRCSGPICHIGLKEANEGRTGGGIRVWTLPLPVEQWVMMSCLCLQQLKDWSDIIYYTDRGEGDRRLVT